MVVSITTRGTVVFLLNISTNEHWLTLMLLTNSKYSTVASSLLWELYSTVQVLLFYNVKILFLQYKNIPPTTFYCCRLIYALPAPKLPRASVPPRPVTVNSNQFDKKIYTIWIHCMHTLQHFQQMLKRSATSLQQFWHAIKIDKLVAVKTFRGRDPHSLRLVSCRLKQKKQQKNVE